MECDGVLVVTAVVEGLACDYEGDSCDLRPSYQGKAKLFPGDRPCGATLEGGGTGFGRVEAKGRDGEVGMNGGSGSEGREEKRKKEGRKGI